MVLRPLLALLLAAPALPALAAPEPAPIVPEAIAPAAEVIVPVELELAAPVAASAAAKPAASQLAKQPVVAGAKAPAAPASGLRQKADAAANATLAALLPLKAFLARSLASGQWPLWNPDASLGKPFLPDLLAGALYPPNLVLAVPPFERGLNLLFVGHYAFTALGALLWLRAAGLTRSAALLGAVVWTFGGTMISMGNVLNQLLSAAWLPWVLWACLAAAGVTVGGALACWYATRTPWVVMLVGWVLVCTCGGTVAWVYSRSLHRPPAADPGGAAGSATEAKGTT